LFVARTTSVGSVRGGAPPMPGTPDAAPPDRYSACRAVVLDAAAQLAGSKRATPAMATTDGQPRASSPRDRRMKRLTESESGDMRVGG